MLKKLLVTLAILYCSEGFSLTRESRLAPEHLVQIKLRECDSSGHVFLDVIFGSSDCTLSIVDGYEATFDELIDDDIYITITDTNADDGTASCVSIAPQVKCEDLDDCLLEDFDTVDLIVTMPDQSVETFSDIEVKEADS